MTGCIFSGTNPFGCIWSGFPWWVQWGLILCALLVAAGTLWSLYSFVRRIGGPLAALGAVGGVLLAVAGILSRRKADDPVEHFPPGHPDAAPPPKKKHRPTIFDSLRKDRP